MIAFVIRRILQSVIVMLVVSLLSFSMFTFLGDPISNMVGQETTIEEREKLRERLGLNDPIPVQFVAYVKNVLSGNFGISFRIGRPVNEILAERIPATPGIEPGGGDLCPDHRDTHGGLYRSASRTMAE